jgi:hypothetical protein
VALAVAPAIAGPSGSEAAEPIVGQGPLEMPRVLAMGAISGLPRVMSRKKHLFQFTLSLSVKSDLHPPTIPTS